MITVRFATVADADAVATLIDDMDAHYRGPGATAGVESARTMVVAAIDAQEGTRFLVAYDGDVAVGLACFALLRPGFRHQGVLFLKDLYVPEPRRGQGIGRRMMRELAIFASVHGIGRIDLTTDAANDGAVALYEGLGAAREAKIMFRFDGEALARLATRS